MSGKGRIDVKAALDARDILNTAVHTAATNGPAHNKKTSFTVVPAFQIKDALCRDALILMHPGQITGDHTLDFYLQDSEDAASYQDIAGPIRFENGGRENAAYVGRVNLEFVRTWVRGRIEVGGTGPQIPFGAVMIMTNPSYPPILQVFGLVFDVQG